ncbi:MAG: phosphoribosylformylglycinamidine synthase subunit PurS [Armatimonadota bacterium]|nr:phosphoribosylformylglycinamidine synthase subunit PurS [Armatimonadota bacterium]MDR7427197.1 phosphoribosylformylglycinamidine synthase subunit PurS [Armatimonadota bacterium]MDR7464820.1 phosphoribosylformylglycinamidine synthase subunit PurS [Armatimonadota bacterium]MDR7470493.1 phosphoribosylformylglycinamidine synthase subunit PurS [Armatimonadota bacterium]MDR7473904.1 phosphoribosylformylglycinamidine synthase subunit PurS [Armatimonadota bacterium]
MRTVRVVITLKPGVLDAPGRAIRQGLAALGFAVEEVRAGKYLELVLPDGPADLEGMCARFLANPLIETWRIEEGEWSGAPGGAAR